MDYYHYYNNNNNSNNNSKNPNFMLNYNTYSSPVLVSSSSCSSSSNSLSSFSDQIAINDFNNKKKGHPGTGGGCGGRGGGGNKKSNVKLSTDPQSIAARQRRHRISDRFKMLQSLVPGGAKLDTVSMLDQAIHYVKFLKAQIWFHQSLLSTSTCAPGPLTDQYAQDNDDPCVYDSFPLNGFCCPSGGSGGGGGGDWWVGADAMEGPPFLPPLPTTPEEESYEGLMFDGDQEGVYPYGYGKY